MYFDPVACGGSLSSLVRLHLSPCLAGGLRSSHVSVSQSAGGAWLVGCLSFTFSVVFLLDVVLFSFRFMCLPVWLVSLGFRVSLLPCVPSLALRVCFLCFQLSRHVSPNFSVSPSFNLQSLVCRSGGVRLFRLSAFVCLTTCLVPASVSEVICLQSCVFLCGGVLSLFFLFPLCLLNRGLKIKSCSTMILCVSTCVSDCSPTLSPSDCLRCKCRRGKNNRNRMAWENVACECLWFMSFWIDMDEQLPASGASIDMYRQHAHRRCNGYGLTVWGLRACIFFEFLAPRPSEDPPSPKVQVLKKCMPLWRENMFPSKKCLKLRVWSKFLKFGCQQQQQ